MELSSELLYVQHGDFYWREETKKKINGRIMMPVSWKFNSIFLFIFSAYASCGIPFTSDVAPVEYKSLLDRVASSSPLCLTKSLLPRKMAVVGAPLCPVKKVLCSWLEWWLWLSEFSNFIVKWKQTLCLLWRQMRKGFWKRTVDLPTPQHTHTYWHTHTFNSPSRPSWQKACLWDWWGSHI